MSFLLVKCEYNNVEIFIFINTIGLLWFKAKEIAQILNYTNVKEAIYTNVNKFDHQILARLDIRNAKIQIPNTWHRHTIFINEVGLYQLILKTRTAEAAVFRKWITLKLLPKMRIKSYELYRSVQDYGYIYIATTTSLELRDIFLIGKSTLSIKKTIKELNSNLYYDEFKIVFCINVNNVHTALNCIVSSLDFCRIFKNKLWFKCKKCILNEFVSLNDDLYTLH